MRYIPTIIVCGFLAGCGAANVQALRDDHAGTLHAHSTDDLATTYARTLRGMQSCYSFTTRGDYVPGQGAANVTTTSNVGNGVWLNANLTPKASGTDAAIDYRMATWRGKAETMQRLVEGKPPGC